MSKLQPVILSGPSGCGKSTLIKKLMSDHPGMFGFSVSHTTRKPREGEQDGKDYHFSDRSKMDEKVAKGEFIETAIYSNNMYGTSKRSVQDVLDAGQICIMDIDSQGVESLRKTDLNCLLIFVKPPSIEELSNRLRKRGTETEEAIERRLEQSKVELAYADQPGIYHHTIVNDDLEVAYGELKAAINQSMDVLS